MRNVTLTADDRLIEQARERARREHSTLNAEFRRWLERYAGGNEAVRRFRHLRETTSYAKAGRTFSRNEMNARR